MTAPGNLERLEAVYKELAKGNMAAASELFSPDVLFMPTPDGSNAIVGPDAAQSYMREFLAQWRNYRITAEAFEELGDTIVVRERQYAAGRISEVSMDAVFYAAWTFRDGKVIRARWETEREKALEPPPGTE